MTGNARRLNILAAICAVTTATVLTVYVWTGAPGHNNLLLQELSAKNELIVHGRKLGIDTNLLFVAITQASYDDELLTPEDILANPVAAELTNSFPWSREVWAAAIEKLVSAGAKVVIVDLIFAAPGRGDAKLREVLDRYPDRVIVGADITSSDTSSGDNTARITYPTESLVSYTNLAMKWADSRVGFVNYFGDPDGVVRKATFRLRGEFGLPPDAVSESIAARTLRKSGKTAMLPSDDAARLFRFSARPGGYHPIALYELFAPSHWTNNFAEGRLFRDKIVIIGPAISLLHDDHQTPFPGDRMLGPEVHLNVIAAARRGEFLGETSWEADIISILCAGAMGWVLARTVRAPLRRLIAAALVSVAYIGLCVVFFNHLNFVLMAFSPLVVLNTGTAGGFVYEFVLERLEKRRTRQTLERYVSKDVVHEILDNPDSFLNSLGGVRRPVTILFSDVRGFTTMTEGADPAQLVMQLNEYFNEMVSIVFAEKGSLDKFIGDAVMALWGAIKSKSEGAERDTQHAVAAALAMRKSLARLNINWKQRGMEELAFGIGINHGEVIFGNLGSDEKRDATVIGDPVNLASRLEGLTKEYKLDLLLGENVVPLVKERFVLRTVGSVKPKGKTVPVRIFTVAADKTAGEQPPAWLPRYEEGLVLYSERKFAEAEQAFVECLRAQPDDHLTKMYRDECRELIAHPPGLDWDTVVVMKSK